VRFGVPDIWPASIRIGLSSITWAVIVGQFDLLCWQRPTRMVGTQAGSLAIELGDRR
jgi:hypothetical protein